MKLRFEIPVIIEGLPNPPSYYFLYRDSLEVTLCLGMSLQLRGMDEEHEVAEIRFFEKDEEQSRSDSCVEVTLANPFGLKELWQPSPTQRTMLEAAGWQLEHMD